MREKLILIFSTTTAILLHPFAFGATLTDTWAETKRAARYAFEGGIFAFFVYQLALKNLGAESFFADLPFAGELVAAVIVASVVFSAIAVHPIARAFSSKPATIHASLAVLLYWSGFCIFVLLPIIALIIFVLSAGADVLSLPQSVVVASSVALLFVAFGIYGFGALASWLGHAYAMSPFMGGLAFLFGYAASFVFASALMAAFQSVIGLTSHLT